MLRTVARQSVQLPSEAIQDAWEGLPHGRKNEETLFEWNLEAFINLNPKVYMFGMFIRTSPDFRVLHFSSTTRTRTLGYND